MTLGRRQWFFSCARSSLYKKHFSLLVRDVHDLGASYDKFALKAEARVAYGAALNDEDDPETYCLLRRFDGDDQ